MGFWQKAKQAFIIEDDTARVEYDVKAINEWLQFCLEHDKALTQFFKETSVIVWESMVEYFPVLQAKRKQCTYKDEYDVVHTDGWEDEVIRFVDSVVTKRLSSLAFTPMLWHYKAYHSFDDVYRAHFEDSSFIVHVWGLEKYDTEEDLNDDEYEGKQMTPGQELERFFIACETDAKQHKENADYKKFLYLKSKQRIIPAKNVTYGYFNNAHTCLPVMFECLLQVKVDKDGKTTGNPAIWTEIAHNTFCSQDHPTTNLLLQTIDHESNLSNNIEMEKLFYDEELGEYITHKDIETYSFLFKTWITFNVFFILDHIFSEDTSKNLEEKMMNNYSFKFGNKKRKAIAVPKTGLEYEKVITNKLKELGFNAKTTKASGDQGADVLADKDGISFAIQCKLYTKPVGNKAVQEANAARDFYKKDYAVVVSNAGYTKSARTAANACDVILINDTQLEKLLEYV